MQHCVLKTFCRNANHVVFVALLVQNASQKRILKMSTPSTFSEMEGEYFNLRYSVFRCSPLRGEYSHSLIIFRHIFSNYWMRLSRIGRILQIKEGVIDRGRWPRWITPSEICNSSYPSKGEFNNCFIIHSKYLLVLKGVLRFCSLFFYSPNITQPCPQIFAVSGSIICSGLHFWRHFDVNGSIIFGGLHFWRHWFNMAKILSKFGEQQLVMVNYACGFNQSETGKYFEWIVILIILVFKC